MRTAGRLMNYTIVSQQQLAKLAISTSPWRTRMDLVLKHDKMDCISPLLMSKAEVRRTLAAVEKVNGKRVEQFCREVLDGQIAVLEEPLMGRKLDESEKRVIAEQAAGELAPVLDNARMHAKDKMLGITMMIAVPLVDLAITTAALAYAGPQTAITVAVAIAAELVVIEGALALMIKRLNRRLAEATVEAARILDFNRLVNELNPVKAATTEMLIKHANSLINGGSDN